ncbi:MAG TPA: hypothetical protein P5123_07830 [Spirochaetota bacterium]|nr:hypothetical protein [Spirochaetota bacterium]
MNISSAVSVVQLSPSQNNRRIYIKAAYDTKNPVSAVKRVGPRRTPVQPEGAIGRGALNRMNEYFRSNHLYGLRGVVSSGPALGRNLDIFA